MNKNYIKNKFEEEIKYLEDGIKNISNPFHFFTLSTMKNSNPKSRTIVLRNVIQNPLRLFFNSDYRSNKILQMKKNPKVSLLFYDNKRRVQLRFEAKANLHYDNDLSKRVWNDTVLQSRKCYMAPYAPSSKLDEWHPNIPSKYLKKDPDREYSEEGYKNFCVVEIVNKKIDVLELHHDGHIRFEIDFQNNESYFISA